MCDLIANVSHINGREQAKSNTGDDGYKCNNKKIHKKYITDLARTLFSPSHIYLMTNT
jgi:hypothetical protein